MGLRMWCSLPWRVTASEICWGSAVVTCTLYQHPQPHQHFSLKQHGLLIVNHFTFGTAWRKVCYALLREGEGGVCAFLCVFLQHTEPKPSNLMGEICKFTPAEFVFTGFSCASFLFVPWEQPAPASSLLWDQQLRSIDSSLSLVIKNASSCSMDPL